MTEPRRIAVVGGGWAGLAAAVEATTLGHAVTLFEMAGTLGGRARRVPARDAAFDPEFDPAHDPPAGLALDNGQHILLGAYTETLRLMRAVGADPDRLLRRLPLTLIDVHGRGLRLPAGAALPAFVRGVLAARGWSRRERLALLGASAGWLVRGFRCAPSLTVAQLGARLPATLRQSLIEPLCVAALNTPAEAASAQVFLHVLRDALFAGPGASDLLLPRVDLSALWPDAAGAWLRAHGAAVHTARRVVRIEQRIEPCIDPRIEQSGAAAWSVDGDAFDRVVLACSATEAARLAAPHAPGWAACAAALRHEPIVTVLLRSTGARLPQPLLALDASPQRPAQFAFDLGQLRDPAREPCAAGVLALVISGAAGALDAGLDATGRAVRAQALEQLGTCLSGPPQVVRVLSDKRATFLCTPGLQRPPRHIAPGLLAAADYVEGRYPATLEGAVRAGVAAARGL